MQKCFILAVCFIQPLFLIAQNKNKAERASFEASQLVDPATGKVPVERLFQAYQQTVQQQQSKARTLNWIEMGPQNNVSGRIRTLTIMPDKRKAFAGGITGGLWVTDDINVGIWRPVNDFFFNLNVSSVTYDPSNPNILYFGTGEDFRLRDQNWLTAISDYNRGQGIWKSIDGGRTWNRLASTTGGGIDIFFHTIRKIVVNNSGEIFIATRNGIFKSSNGGTLWIRSLDETMTGLIVQANDLEIGMDGTIYASLGLVNEEGVVFRLQPTRTIWERLNNGINGMPTLGSNTFRRTELACSMSNPNVVYALTENIRASAFFPAITLYRSPDRGNTWQIVNLLGVPIQDDPATPFVNEEEFEQAHYALSIAVDPTNENNVYIGSRDIYRCLNVTSIGNRWTRISEWSSSTTNYVHADQHQIVFESASNSKAYITTDGGIFRSTNLNAATPIFTAINRNLRITQFYNVSTSAGSSTFQALGGTQDNGTQQFDNGYLSNTRSVLGGDGAYCFIAPNNSLNRVVSSQNGNYSISTDGGVTFIRAGTRNRGSFINPTDWAVLPSGQVNMFSDGNDYGAGTNEFFRWDNIFGGTPTPTRFSDALFLDGGVLRDISFIKVSPNNVNTVYIGFSERGSTTTRFQLVRMTNANSATPTFTDITGDINITAYLSCIAIKKSSSGFDDEMVLTFSNYGIKNIWYTATGRSNNPTWRALDQECNTAGCLPDMPIRYALFIPDVTFANPSGYKLLLATETGVWATKLLENEATKWYPINGGKLPNVRTQMLTYRPSDGMLFVATHGRGLWRSDMFSPKQVDFTAIVQQSGFGIRTLCKLNLIDNSEGATSWDWDLNNDGSIDGISQYQRFDYCGNSEQEIRLTINRGINSVSVVKRLNEIVPNLPSYCPCAVISDVGSELPSFLLSKEPFEFDSNEIAIYPNPSSGVFTIRLNTKQVIESIDIYNSIGKLIQTVNSKVGDINLETEPNGIYICRVKTSTGALLTGKIIKQ